MGAAEVEAAPSDAELVGAALAGDRSAFADLVRRYERQVHAVAWAILRDHHAAQDVTQDTFVRAYGRLASLRSAGAVGPWLLTTARRAALDRARRPRGVRFVADVPDQPAAGPPSASDAEADAARVFAAVARLPGGQQQAVLLRYVDGLSVADVAERLGRSVGTTTKQLSRALARLRDQLRDPR